MDEGEVYLKKSFLNTVAFGWGATDLVFRRSSTKREVELMTPWDFSKAYHCIECGATVIATTTGKDD
jgi:hypothetical protein